MILLLDGYSVTDKADGLANILFKVGLGHLNSEERETLSYLEGYVYLIDQNLNVFHTGVKINDNMDSIILNGEYLNFDKDNNQINSYGVYDSYIVNNRDICSLKLISNDPIETRNKIGVEYVRNLENCIVENPLELDIYSTKNSLFPMVE